jgi:hypothetical protein
MECYEGMGDWQNDELWARGETESYPQSWAVWFLIPPG